MKSYLHSKKHYFPVLIAGLLILNVLFTSNTFGNGITISNISYSQVNGTVNFTLSWNNSWRNSGQASNNWDAAWVFVKWRDCSLSPSAQFTHGLVNTNVALSNFNDSSGATTFQPTDRFGNAPAIDAAPNNTGVMLRNAADLTAGIVSATVTLKLTNLPATGTLDMRVFGVEMVFVPQGAYVLGDGNGQQQPSYYSFTAAVPSSQSYTSILNTNGSGSYTAAGIGSENAQAVYDGYPAYRQSPWICYCYQCAPNSTTVDSCALSAAFPKGYAAFYIMKYEISQGEYADFLNASNSICQSIHFPNQNGNSRNTIVNTGTPPTQFSATRRDRACNYLGWTDVSTYLDWAALRPLSELEFEKACRGTNEAVLYEDAWGTDTTVFATTISGTENGTETITAPAGANTAYYSTYTGGDASSGPLRCGIFATGTTTTRKQTGASFYGAMELSGNVFEYYLSAFDGTSFGYSYTGVSEGDGILDTGTGNHNTSNWPPALVLWSTNSYNPSQPNTGTFIIRRGGSWASQYQSYQNSTCSSCVVLNVSDRCQSCQGSNYYGKVIADQYSGGRGGR